MAEWLLTGWDDVPDVDILSASPVPNYDVSDFQSTLRRMDTSYACENYHLFHIKMLSESMRTGGWIGASLVAFTDGCLPDGNHRVRAAKLAGITVPVSAAIDRETYYEFYEWDA